MTTVALPQDFVDDLQEEYDHLDNYYERIKAWAKDQEFENIENSENIENIENSVNLTEDRVRDIVRDEIEEMRGRY